MPYVRTLPSDAELLRAALAAAPLGVVVFDRDLRYVAVNERLAEANGLPVTAHAGHTVREVLPVEANYLEPLLRRALAGESLRETWVDIWIAHRHEYGSSRVWFTPVSSPTPDGPDEVIGVLAMLEDVTTEVRTATRADSARALAEDLSRVTSLDEVARLAGSFGEATLGAALGVLGVLDEHTDDLLTYPASEEPGSGDAELASTARSEAEASLRTVARSGRELDTVGSGAAFPLRVEGRVLGALSYSWEAGHQVDEEDLVFLRAVAARVAVAVERVVSNEREARAASRAEALLDVATKLNTATSLSQVSAALVEAVSALTVAVEAGVYALSDDEQGLERLDDSPAVDPERRVKYDLLPTDGATPVALAVREATTLWLQEREDWEPFPLVAADGAAMGWPVIAVVPLIRGDRDSGTALGALYAHYPPPYRLAVEDQQFLITLAALGSAALSRATLMEAEKRAIEALDLSELRMSRLAEAGACGVLEATDTHIVKANGFLLDMLGYDELPPGGLDWRAVTPPGWEEVDAAAMDDLRTRGVTEPFTKEYLRADGTPVPVLLSVATYRTDPFSAVAVVIDLTKQRQLEADHRRQVAERESLTRAVQSALFPVLRIEHDWVSVDVGYRAGDSRMALGGDFYDVCSRPDGRLGVVIGDVTGHGPDAAANGAALRAAWRTLTISGASLADIPGTLDQMLTAERSAEEDQLMATVGLAALSADGTVETLTAGHPRAIVLTAAGAREIETPYGPILGAGIPSTPRSATTRLQPGDRLLLYTDGVIEARAGASTRDRLGLPGFLALLDALPSDFACHTVLDEVTRLHGDPLPDDAALVLLELS